MARHSHLNRSAINAIATEPITKCRDYPHSASSTTKLQRRQYGMMTQRRRQRLNRLGTTVDDSTVTKFLRYVTRPQPIFATRHSSTRYSSSTHCHRRYNSVDATFAALRSVEPPPGARPTVCQAPYTTHRHATIATRQTVTDPSPARRS